MQVDGQQTSHQLSEAPHQVTTPGSMLGLDIPHHHPAYLTSPIYAATSHANSPWQAQQQRCFSALQGRTGLCHRAASTPALVSDPQKGLFPASASAGPSLAAPQPEGPTAHWQQTPQAVTTYSRPPSQPCAAPMPVCGSTVAPATSS